MQEDYYFARFEKGRYYHIYNRANSNSDKLYFAQKNYHYFLQKFNEHLSSYLTVWAYCLIPNHFHFLIRVKETIPPIQEAGVHDLISEKFRIFFIGYSQAINRQENRRGSLFSKRFNRILIDSEDYLSSLVHYIHYNPIHHNLTDTLLSWKFNSYLAHISDKKTNLAKNEVLEWFGDKQAFINFHAESKDYSKASKYIIEK